MFPEGKFKRNIETVKALQFLCGYKNSRSIDQHISKLQSLGFLKHHAITNYYILYSYEKLKQKHNWRSRIAIVTIPEYLQNSQAFYGVSLYASLYRDFRRKEITESFVPKKGGTSTNFPVLSPFDNYKPVATTGINKLFPNISIASASRLKSSAHSQNLLSVRKNYLDLNLDVTHVNLAKTITSQVKIKDGKLYLQQIDTILPFVQLKRRKN